MRAWRHLALMVCLSIKWLTNQVAAESIICDDDREMCTKPKSDLKRTYLRFGKDGDSNSDATYSILSNDEDDESGMAELDSALTKRGDPYIRFGKSEVPYFSFATNQGVSSEDDLPNDGIDDKEKRHDPYIRFGKRQDPYIRFGKRQDPYIRFGKRHDPYIRFGKRQDPYIRFGKRQDPYIRFGKRQDPYIRFGKRQDPYIRFGKRQDPYIRFGKRQDPYIRFGKRQDPYIRFGKRQDPYIRFGKRQDPYIRFGKRQDPYIRFGKRQDPYIRFGKRQDPYIRFGKRQDPYIRFGKRDDTFAEQLEKQRGEVTFSDAAAVVGQERSPNGVASPIHSRKKRSEDQSLHSSVDTHHDLSVRLERAAKQGNGAKTAGRNNENTASGVVKSVPLGEIQPEAKENTKPLSRVARNGGFPPDQFDDDLLDGSFVEGEFPGNISKDLQMFGEAGKFLRPSRGGRSSLPRFGK